MSFETPSRVHRSGRRVAKPPVPRFKGASSPMQEIRQTLANANFKEPKHPLQIMKNNLDANKIREFARRMGYHIGKTAAKEFALQVGFPERAALLAGELAEYGFEKIEQGLSRPVIASHRPIGHAPPGHHKSRFGKQPYYHGFEELGSYSEAEPWESQPSLSTDITDISGEIILPASVNARSNYNYPDNSTDISLFSYRSASPYEMYAPYYRTHRSYKRS